MCKYRRTHREKSGGRGAHLHTDGLSEPELLRQRTGLELDLGPGCGLASLCPQRCLTAELSKPASEKVSQFMSGPEGSPLLPNKKQAQSVWWICGL